MRKYYINGVEVSAITYIYFYVTTQKQILDHINLALKGLTNYDTYLFDIQFEERVE